MKVLEINSVCKRGSTGKIAYELYRRGNTDGHEFAVAYGRGEKIEEKNIFKFGLDAETCAHAFLTRVTGYTGCFSPLSTRRLLGFMEEFEPDIVHLHEPHAYFLDIRPFFEYLAARKLPLVYTMHCEFAYTGKCGYAMDCTGYINGCGNCPRLREYPKTLGMDRTAQMYAEKRNLLLKQDMTVVTPSRWLADRAKKSFLCGSDVRVIKNGIDTENVFYPRPYERLKTRLGLMDKKIVLAVALNFISNKEKGARFVLELAERMKKEPVKFILIGADAPVENTPENVILLGRTENQAELAEYYSMADCFVIGSEIDNLPTTCLEAVCCGTPVVGFDTGGTAETAPAPLGRFSPPGDMDALEKNLRRMLENTPAPESFGELQKQYSSAKMYSEYMKIYTEILDGKDK